MKCFHCGATNGLKKNYKICPFCGMPLVSEKAVKERLEELEKEVADLKAELQGLPEKTIQMLVRQINKDQKSFSFENETTVKDKSQSDVLVRPEPSAHLQYSDLFD